jgi:hypothetical protein
MARKKTSVPPVAEPETDANPRQKNILSLKGTDAWKTWLDEFAESKGMPVTVLVDHSLREQAKRDGFRVPPTRVP